MSDYIKRDEAIRLVGATLYTAALTGSTEIIIDGLNKIPAAEVAPVRDGHWDSSHDGHRWVLVCSECGAWDYDEGGYKPHFCHSCGAKMKGSEQE